MAEKGSDIKNKIFDLVREYYNLVHQPLKRKKFVRGNDKVNYGGRVFDDKEIINLVDSALEFWLSEGRFADCFNKKFTKFLNVKHCILTNSGSSANMLAISALTSPKIGKRQLKPGDEVITTACAFPTTISPIIHNNLVPVFIDIDIGTYNIHTENIEKAISERTKAIFLTHTLGNPFDLNKVRELTKKYNLWLIEDACDALGSKYNGRYIGTFGDLATFSFYPAHHITMGEGGAVVMNDDNLMRITKSFRDWGRDCWCAMGEDNTCRKRFAWKLGDLPYGYDHKYIYSHFGYNLKITDMQAAVGLAQLEKLPEFIKIRRMNWQLLKEGLKDLSDFFILPYATLNSEPSWFGFIITIKENTGFKRNDIVEYLEKQGIQTRMLFAGNIIRQPCFDSIRRDKSKYRIVGDLHNTDKILKDTFWTGVYPGITKYVIEYIIDKIREFVRKYEK